MLNLSLIGKRISQRRKELDFTQNFIAESLYVTHQAVSKWENGKSLPTIDILYELTKLLEVSIDYLLDDTDIAEHDYETKFKNFDRESVLGEFLSKEDWYQYINDIFYLLNSKERFKVINKIVHSEECFVIKNIWPYLNDEERIYILGIILGGKCTFELKNIYHQLTTQEQLFVQRKVNVHSFNSKK
ncbi:HTH-type transcriptional regulator ImmR [Candidatus Izimaplasma bacterium HR1]|jgi:transcriptional regulator with XRE-family HTH domain|uniref:helix-turn-helix domain-containing protein n=1 Tax=Candidatus Izimoplasma sp. HR1 TaxID=1541959 RepID=UPI0004F8455B|nr:HTH-type transcriptional regulator ImmR [Candidatus Izimaplasma bacterium HR1]